MRILNVEQLIELLEKYPKDMEIVMSDFYTNHDEKIFKIAEVEDWTGEKQVHLMSSPHYLQAIKTFEDIGENTTYNLVDEFKLYKNDGDCVVWNKGAYETIYPNLQKNLCEYEDYMEYQSDDFHTVGGLRKFLESQPQNQKINISIGDCYQGVINKITQKEVDYFVGVDYRNGDVYDETHKELFFELGLELYGSDSSLTLDGATIPYNSDELMKCLSKPLKDKFEEEKVELDTVEQFSWSRVIKEQQDLLYKYYDIFRRIDASHDCNGYYHLHEKEYPFKIFGRKNKYEL